MTEEYDLAEFVPSRVELDQDGRFHIFNGDVPYYTTNRDLGTEAKKAMLLKRRVSISFKFDGLFRHVQSLSDAKREI